MQVKIADVMVIYRLVDLPTVCGECKEAINPDDLGQLNLRDVILWGRIDPETGDLQDSYDETGESTEYIPWGYSCSNCRATLMFGEHRRLAPYNESVVPRPSTSESAGDAGPCTDEELARRCHEIDFNLGPELLPRCSTSTNYY